MDAQSIFVRLLGKVEVIGLDGSPLALPGRRSLALLACLAEPDGSWTRERLALLLWRGRGPDQARASLRQELLRLRRAIGLAATDAAERSGLPRLAGDGIAFDTHLFMRAATEERPDEAASLYHGAFLQGVAFEEGPLADWLSERRRRFHETAAASLVRWLRAADARGDAAAAERAARQLVSLDPCSEIAHRWLIRCFAARRDLGKVLEQFRLCGEALRLEHGAVPSAETRALVDEVVTGLAGSGQRSRAEPLERPSIAVLPFANMTHDAEQDYFADGMSEEIITALSRIRWLFVIARNSSFAYKGRTTDVKQIGEELGVRYVLEGSVRRARDRLRITSHLVDAATGASVWADRYDGLMTDVFELQDRVAASVAGAIEPTLEAAEIRRASERPTSDLSAYDLYLRALPHIFSWDRDRVHHAMELLDEAIRRDGSFGPALAYAACCRVQLNNNNWSANEEQNWHEGIALARRALQADPDNPMVLGNAALVLGFFLEDLDSCLALVDRAVNLNPSFALGWQWSGFLRLLGGDLGTAVAHFEHSLRLSPSRDRWNGSCLAGIGIARFFDREFDKAAAILLRSIDELPNFATTYRFLAACYAHMGRLDEARAVLKRMQPLTPAALVRARMYRNPAHRQLYLDGINLALSSSSGTPPQVARRAPALRHDAPRGARRPSSGRRAASDTDQSWRAQ